MEKEFLDKHVWISGASRGIGRATALAFAQQGAHLYLIGRNEVELKSTQSECLKHKIKCEIFTLDLTDFASVKNHFSKFKQIDVAVNNAGFEGRWADISELELSDYDSVMNINVKSMWYCLKQQTIIMKKQKSGNIINVASISAQKFFPSETLYCTSKAAVVGLTKALAVEQIKNGIRVNCISPGGVDTAMLNRAMDINEAAKAHPIGRVAKPEEIALAILWVVSERATFMVGHNLITDGGLTLI